jgi:predicted amidohydrolase
MDRHIAILSNLKEEGADVVAFPELSLTGYLMKDVAFEVSKLCKGAIETISEHVPQGQKCICGFVREERLGMIQNAASIIGHKSIEGTVAKFYLPTYGLFEEMRYFVPGTPAHDLKTFSIKGINFGVLICEDAWHPEPVEALARLGSDVIICIASSPARGVQRTNANKEILIESQWKKLLSAHALMNNIFMVFVNRAGPEDEEYFWGGSMIISPTGEVASQAKKYEEDLLVADIDLQEVSNSRKFSSFKDHRPGFHKVLEDL